MANYSISKQVYVTSDYSVFNIFPENRGFTFDTEEAIKNGKLAESVNRFRKRVNAFKKHFRDVSYSDCIVLPVWQDENGLLWLGDGATRITALQELAKEGSIKNLPNVQFFIQTHLEISRNEFVDKMRMLNANNGSKWDITDKIEYAATVWGAKKAQKVLELKKKYGYGTFILVDVVLNKQGTAKQNYNFEEQIKNGDAWAYSDDFCEFISLLHRNCTTDFKAKIISEKSFTILRQIYSLIASQKLPKEIVKKELDLTMDILCQSINSISIEKASTSLKEWWGIYLKVLSNNKKEYSKLNFEIRETFADIFYKKVMTSK